MKYKTNAHSKEVTIFMVDRQHVNDGFYCLSCGYSAKIRVLGDSCRCPNCGSTMHRRSS